MDPLTEIPAWLAGASSLADVLQLAHENQKDVVPELLWKRCALAGRWNETLYPKLIQDLPGHLPSFEGFRDMAGVVCSGSFCSVVEQLRSQYIKLWTRDDPELARTCALLESYFKETGDSDRRLGFLLLARPDEGVRRFIEQYTAADQGFDLGRCEALLRILRGQYLLLSDAARGTLNDREQYLQSREIFAQDYYRSLVYLSRENLESACDAVLADAGPWIVNLYGQGGLGKTMFVRRLIAHRCIPEFNSERTPVARVDLDFLDLALLAEHPQLLLLEAARQLRPQLVGSPFLTLLGPEHISLARLLRSKGIAQRPEDRQWMETSSLRRREQIQSVFVQGLGAKRAVLVVDTLEEIMLHQPQAMADLLNLFFAVHDLCPGFRVLFSGRYAMHDANRRPLPISDSVRARLQAEMTSVQIQPFSEERSREYLRNVRHLENSSVINAIVKRSSGNPFELSLFADLALTRPLLSVEDVAQCPDVKLAYLVERVIDRMPDEPVAPGDPRRVVRQKRAQLGARWLVRYAVIPRQLTPSFIKDVLRRFLEEEMSGKTSLDATIVPGYETDRWRRESVVFDDEAINDIWNELQKYASGYNWVEGNEQALQLHAEVVVPMRELLRQKPDQYPIYDLLHRAGAEYFERLAGLPDGPFSSTAGQHLADALYHRFQVEGQTAKPYWERYRGICRGVSADAVTDLTSSVLNTKDYLDDDRAPLQHFRAGLLIDTETLADIALEHAHASLLAWLRSLQGPSTDVANAVRKGLEDWKQFRGAPEIAPKGWLLLLEAAQALFAKQSGRARQLVDQNEIASLAVEDRIAAHLLLMRVFRAGTAESDSQYDSVLQIAQGSAPAAFPEYFLRAIYGQNLANRDVETALKHLDLACEMAINQDPKPGEASMILQWFGDLCYSNGELSRLERNCRIVTSDVDRFSFPLREQASDWHVRCLADCRRLFSEATKIAVHHSLVEPVRVGLRALIAAAMFRFEEARQFYEQAELLYKTLGLESGAIGLRLELANLYLEKMGNPLVAQSYLISVKEPLEMLHLVKLQQSRIRLSAARDDAQQVRAVYRESAETLRRSDAPGIAHATVQATFLATGLGNDDDGDDFLEQLRSLPLSSSHYAALQPFINADPWRPLRQNQRSWRMLDESEESPDWFHHNLAFAAACSFFDERDKLARSLRKGMERAVNPDQLFAIRSLIPESLAGEFPPEPAYLQRWDICMPEEPAYAAIAFLVEGQQALYRQDLQAAENLVERYFNLASHGLPKHQHWSLRGLLLRALVAEANNRIQDAQLSLKEALDLALQLGNQAALRFLQKAYDRISSSFGEAAQGYELNHDECRIDHVPGGLKLTFRSRYGPDSSVVNTSPLARMIADEISDLYPHQLVEQVRYSGVQFVDSPFAVDLADMLRSRPSNAGLPLRLRIPISAASAIPWEAGAIHSVPVGLYRSSYSPIPQPLEFAEGTPSALIVQPDAEAERFDKRGYGVTGLSIAESYRRVGFHVIEPPSASLSSIQQSLIGSSPSIVHIYGTLVDSTSVREVYLALNSRFNPQGEWLAPSSLASMLQAVVSRPLIILDNSWDPDDEFRQGLLRNYFAAALFESSTLRAVLATGGYRPEGMSAFLSVLNRGLADRRSLIQLHADLLYQTMPVFAPALFTNDGDLRVF